MRKGEALRILRDELELEDTSTSYDFTVEDEVRSEAENVEWWRPSDDGLGETARNKAYFRAYLRIANGDEPIRAGDIMPTQGLRLKPRGRLWMDRYVIGKMLQRQFLEYQQEPKGLYEPAFVLTEAGEEWCSK